MNNEARVKVLFKTRSERRKRELKIWNDIMFVPSGLTEKRVRGGLGLKTWMSKSVEQLSLFI